MERRHFIQLAGTTALLTTFLNKSWANPTPPPEPVKELVLNHEIGRNHNHLLSLSPVGVIELLRQVHGKTGEVIELSIKGTSSHDHLIQLNEDMLTALLAVGEISLDSSLVAGHTHPVIIKLEVVNQPEAGS